MDERHLKENIRAAISSYQDETSGIADRLEFADGLYENFIANPNLMSQLPDLSYEDLESYLHDKIRSRAKLLDGLDIETLEQIILFPVPTKKV